jgi:hypothetical protein
MRSLQPEGIIQLNNLPRHNSATTCGCRPIRPEKRPLRIATRRIPHNRWEILCLPARTYIRLEDTDFVYGQRPAFAGGALLNRVCSGLRVSGLRRIGNENALVATYHRHPAHHGLAGKGAAGHEEPERPNIHVHSSKGNPSPFRSEVKCILPRMALWRMIAICQR